MVDLAGNGGWECECECVLCTVYCLYWKLIFVTLLSKESFLCGCFSCSLHSKAKDQGKRGTCTDIDYRYNQRHPKTYIVWERKRGGERERERERENVLWGVSREETCPSSSQHHCSLLLLHVLVDPKGLSLFSFFFLLSLFLLIILSLHYPFLSYASFAITLFAFDSFLSFYL